MMSKKGFTLVELLIVIAIIGVLVGALIVGLDPIEQIRRGRDAARAASLREFINACERHYAISEDVAGSCAELSQELKNCAQITGEINAVWSADCRASTFTAQSQHYQGADVCGDTTCTIAEIAGLL